MVFAHTLDLRLEHEMKARFTLQATAVILLTHGTATGAVSCGGNFEAFVDNLGQEAVASGHSLPVVDSFFANAVHDPNVIRRDRTQGIFKKSFIEFSKLVMSEYRMVKGREFERKHNQLFDKVQQRYGVQRGVLLAFLALETDYGVVQGDFNTLNSLVTLAHDCRRPELFRPHIFAALELYESGDFDPVNTIGAWAGEIGMIQMLPEDVLLYGEDGDGDKRVDISKSPADALMTAGKVLHELGWVPYEPWLVEIIVPKNLDWSATGLNHSKPVSKWKGLGIHIRNGDVLRDSLEASVLLPQGRNGPAFFAFPNYRIYFEWNRSFVYATTSAFFATRLSGKPLYLEGNPSPPLAPEDLELLQQLLAQRGRNVGPIDGILGAMTRAAVQNEQIELGLPADGWPTTELLELLK